MCRIYAGIDPAEYQPITRSLRLHGAVTSLRLEARFWSILDRMAAAESVSTPRFLGTLYDEALEVQGDVGNFASLLRVACTTFLARSGEDAAPASTAEPRPRPAVH